MNSILYAWADATYPIVTIFFFQIQVSSKRHNLHIQVMEPVKGLTILDCCDTAIPVGVKRTFVANILKGKPVHYLWTFDLHHLNKATHMSQEVVCLYLYIVYNI